MESGMPGSPPPVPTSSILALGIRRRNLVIVRQWAICLISSRSVSFRETKLIFAFHSRRRSQYSSNFSQISSPRSGNHECRIFQGSVESLIKFNQLPPDPNLLPIDQWLWPGKEKLLIYLGVKRTDHHTLLC